MPVKTGIQVMDSVPHIIEEQNPDQGVGMDPGFHRGDDADGMTKSYVA